MEDILFVLLIISFLLFVFGLFSPKTSLFWTKTNRTRGKSSLIYGLTAILLFVAFGESTTSSSQKPDNFVDKKLSFYDPSDENYTLNKWIRKPENIRTLHETFKKYGYSKLFSDSDLTSNPCLIWSYINKPCGILIDSLIITYPQADNSPKYYTEFWSRRKAEQNDTTVYTILKEIKDELINESRLTFNEQLTNDTIYNLLRIKFKQPDNEAEAMDNFDYLTKVGLNLSAYNLLYETVWYENFTWDREKLKEKLQTDTVDCCPYPIIVDDTK